MLGRRVWEEGVITGWGLSRFGEGTLRTYDIGDICQTDKYRCGVDSQTTKCAIQERGLSTGQTLGRHQHRDGVSSPRVGGDHQQVGIKGSGKRAGSGLWAPCQKEWGRRSLKE